MSVISHHSKISYFIGFSLVVLLINAILYFSPQTVCAAEDNALLFYLSGENQFTADYALGNPEPVSLADIELIPDGVRGYGFRCPHFNHIFAYNAPGNIYAQCGTLAFFFRARDPWGKTPFKIFQASHSDHTSFDMSWLRIDYNGGGFDAFITDVNLARMRVSYMPQVIPSAVEWIHIALSWDENTGIKFYVDGLPVAQKDTTAVYYAGLGIMGAHGYMINNLSIGSGGPDIRGGDFDEFRIYDRALSDENIARLAMDKPVENLLPVNRSLAQKVFRDEWYLRYGWNRPGDIPPYLDAPSMKIRKVEIHDAYDLKQWIWKGCDGIRETTWPNVYNRSKLPGRTDYFILPDWNCYSTSGKSITFSMPDEPWNYIEITGAAYGSFDLLDFDMEKSGTEEIHLFDRPEHQERTFHEIRETVTGGKVRFTNVFPEMPIGEFSVYHLTPGREPKGETELTYIASNQVEPDNPSLKSLVEYIEGRFLPDERELMVALPAGAPRNPPKTEVKGFLPLVHILIPFEFRTGKDNGSLSRYSYTWENLRGGLDGIAIEIPALDVQPTHDEYFPLNIQIKDPLWPERNIFDFSFSVKPGEPKNLWLDTRDCVMPNGYSLYITVAGAGNDFGTSSLEGARIRLIFKDREEAMPEHEIDRFTQVRDNYGNQIEAGPNNKALGLYKRFNLDITDLFQVNPNHVPGIYYWSYNNPEQGWPEYKQPEPSDSNVPLWAFRQIEYLKLVSDIILWWIDNRQIENGELGGGLSDDSDYTNVWPIPALNGVESEKVTDSLHRVMEAIYDNGMLTDGINTITADGLHVTEEGNNVQGQLMLLEYGDPKLMERMMESVRGFERVTGINNAGHRHFRSGYFGAHHIATEIPWVYSRYQTSRILHPAMYVAEFSGNPRAKKLILELADGLLAHRKQNENGNWYTPANINFETDEDMGDTFGNYNHVFWGAWCWTRDDKYLQPLIDNGVHYMSSINGNVIDVLNKRDTWGKQISASATPYSGSTYARHVAWQLTGNKQFLEEYYADEIQFYAQRKYLYTEGHFWTDRIGISASELQRSRLGGVAKRGKGNIYPGQTVSWKFKKPATYEDLAILIPKSNESEFKVVVFNLSDAPVTAIMTGWMVYPGTWEMIQGTDTDDDDTIDSITDKKTVEFGRTEFLEIVFNPKVQTVVNFKLKKKGKPYWERHDLGIGVEDITVTGDMITVTVHSLGSVNAPKSLLTLKNKSGEIISYENIPAIEAPLDLIQKTAKVKLRVPTVTSLSGYSVCIEPKGNLKEITMINNSVKLP